MSESMTDNQINVRSKRVLYILEGNIDERNNCI